MTLFSPNQTGSPLFALNGDFWSLKTTSLCCSGETTGASPAAEARRSCEMLTSAGKFSSLEGKLAAGPCRLTYCVGLLFIVTGHYVRWLSALGVGMLMKPEPEKAHWPTGNLAMIRLRQIRLNASGNSNTPSYWILPETKIHSLGLWQWISYRVFKLLVFRAAKASGENKAPTFHSKLILWRKLTLAPEYWRKLKYRHMTVMDVLYRHRSAVSVMHDDNCK